jgi:DNA-binding transcriptional LysR family regulator
MSRHHLNGKEDIVRSSGRFLANSGDALLAFALRDGGVALAPDYLVEKNLKAGRRLIRLLPEYATQETAVNAGLSPQPPSVGEGQDLHRLCCVALRPFAPDQAR